ncbi:hypothetical protein GCM10017687_82280 [Streptomyces echinatus]
MTLPAPHLDDRRFQDIVDEAKRRIALRCPDWTAHNVSDPGVALIELFAWMTEMILYRLNQVPDRLYVKFLELVGVSLYSAAPARTDLLFELAGPAKDTIVVRKGTRVGTERDQTGDQVVFMTEADLRIVPPELVACRTRGGGSDEDRTAALGSGAEIAVFPAVTEGDALYLGFRQGLAGNLVRLDVTVADAHGAGIDPDRPPRVWQSWDGEAWRDARVLADTSGGFNSTGQVNLLLHVAHEQLAVGGVTAYWLRCVLRGTEGQPAYQTSPLLQALTVSSQGGVVKAHHAESAPAELLGTSTGRPGQNFVVRRAPVLPRTPDEKVRVISGRSDGTAQTWYEVRDFTGAGEEDRVFTWSGGDRRDPVRPEGHGQDRRDAPVRRHSPGERADHRHRLSLRRRQPGQCRRRQAHRPADLGAAGRLGTQSGSGDRRRRRRDRGQREAPRTAGAARRSTGRYRWRFRAADTGGGAGGGARPLSASGQGR